MEKKKKKTLVRNLDTLVRKQIQKWLKIRCCFWRFKVGYEGNGFNDIQLTSVRLIQTLETNSR